MGRRQKSWLAGKELNSHVLVCSAITVFRLTNRFMAANTMNPEQTAPYLLHTEQSDQRPYCLQYRLQKNISRREEQTTQVVTGEKSKLISFGIPCL